MLASASLIKLLVVLVSLLTLITAVRVLRRGLWPARQGSDPHCRHCDYNLTGLEPGLCPECGKAWTADTVARGERHRQPVEIVRGALVLAVSLGTIGFLVLDDLPRIDYYRRMPASLVLWQVSSSTPATAQRAIDEFQRRIPSGSVSSEQIGQFLQKVVTFSPQVRPTIIQADPVIFKADMNTASIERIGIQVVETRYQVDDCPVMSDPPSGSYFAVRGRLHTTYGTVIGSLPAGKHKVRFWYRVHYFYDTGKAGRAPPAGSPLLDRETMLEASFEVLPSETPGYIKLIRDPGLRQAMHNSIQVKSLKLQPGQSLDGKSLFHGNLEVSIANCPAPAAFNAFVRTNDSEYRLATVTFHKGLTTSYGTACVYEGPLADTVDIILRTSTKVARRSLDMFETWDGELVYPNVPVQIDPKVWATASQATSS